MTNGFGSALGGEVVPRTQEDIDSPGNERSDRDLLCAVADGDKHALGVLYQRFSGRLLGVARRTLANQEDAEDIVHDVFLEVWRRAADYDASRGSVAAWLLVRTRSRAIDRLKSPSQRRRAVLNDEPLGDDEAGGVENALPNEMRDPTIELDGVHVWQAVGELPSEQRAVVELAYFEGLTMAEVGVCLGIPPGTVKSRLSRAMAAMRAQFV